ncbi:MULTISPECIES: hypothetical protein [Wolbachia]|uniref:hypothetical protein n=1 Tax=Wolbachia TaxID=953 RepID=UPI00157A754F|nr:MULTISPECIES: hypothetical protein [Wolbachia]MBS9529595.1 hypothetical protein [Wolbachia endosymbiont of Ceratitis capitata]
MQQSPLGSRKIDCALYNIFDQTSVSYLHDIICYTLGLQEENSETTSFREVLCKI